MVVGFVFEILCDGDVRFVLIVGYELLFICDRDGIVCCFYNICCYWGMCLVLNESLGQCQICCGWYCWIYVLDGWLMVMLNFNGICQLNYEGFDMDQFGLIFVWVGVWYDFVFVNIDGQVEELL